MPLVNVNVRSDRGHDVADLRRMTAGNKGRAIPIYCGFHPGAGVVVLFDRDLGELHLFCPLHEQPVFMLSILVASSRPQ